MRLLPRSRRGALWRFFFAALLVIAASAGTTAVAGLLQFNDLVHALNAGGAGGIIQDPHVTLPQPGAPQTILIVGSDHRAGEPFSYALTDTMLLVRLNADSSTINMMSIPRDLQVQIPGFGTGKLNAAYSDGGTPLLVKTIQQDVFPGFHPNHVVDINFGGFSALVNAIGCVYTDVDHRYYNLSAPGPNDYSSIDIQPGYQKLCGTQALQFVRFRHTDSDLVRSARQQDFIRWAKDQYGAANLINNRERLLSIFGSYTETDHSLHTTDGLINLFDLVAFSAVHAIKQIRFPAILEPCGAVATAPTAGSAAPVQACYVTAQASAEAAVFRAFMRATKPSAAPVHKAAVGGKPRPAGQPPSSGLTDAVSDGHSQAAQLHGVRMPILYPRLKLAGSLYCLGIIGNCPLEIASPGSYPRGYTIHDQQNRRHPAYYMTIAVNPVLGEYYGVQGTTWQHPPILARPTGIRVVAGKRLELFAGGGTLTDVAWHTPHGVYWISNTLAGDLDNQQMVAIAASLTRANP